MNVKTLTPKQKEVLDFVNTFYNKKGYSPSLEEMARRFKKSIPTIHQFIDTLVKKGYLTRTENTSRGIVPNADIGIEIPLLGYIAAGEPIEPVENPEPINVPLSMVSKSGQYYALKAKGDSMIEGGILDGDTVVVKHQLTAESGEMVVAITENGATLKIFRKKNGRIFLEPRNEKLKSIYPENLEIRGKFVGLVRSSNHLCKKGGNINE